MMNRYQLAQAMTDINRIRPQVQMPPPAAPQVMSQQQRMVPMGQPSQGPGAMQSIGDTLQQAFLQRAIAKNAGLKNAGMNNDFGQQGIPYADWMMMR